MRRNIIRITAIILALAMILVCSASLFAEREPSEEEQPAAKEAVETHAVTPARRSDRKNTEASAFEEDAAKTTARPAAPRTPYTAGATARDGIWDERHEAAPMQDKVSDDAAPSKEDGYIADSLAEAEETAPRVAEKNAETACAPKTSGGTAEDRMQTASGVPQENAADSTVPASGAASESTAGDAGQDAATVSEEEDRYDALALSDGDLELLARLVYLEARGEPYEGQVAVAEVVLNRVLSDRFPDTVEEVIYQTGQFTPASYLESTTPGEEQYEAVADAVDGEACVTGENVVFFSGAPYNDRVYAVIGNHYFCEL